MKKAVDKLKEHYEQYWIGRGRRNILRYARLTRARCMLRLLPPGDLGKVLDVGCGDGTTLEFLGNFHKLEPFGIDLSERAVREAKRRGVRAVVANAEEGLPFKSNSFDLVICSEVLEHLVIPEKALEEIMRVAKGGALFLLSVPNLGYIRNRIQLLFGRSPCEEGEFSRSAHLHFWTKASFIKFIKKRGFEAIRVTGRPNRRFGPLAKVFPSLLSSIIFVLAKAMEGRSR